MACSFSFRASVALVLFTGSLFSVTSFASMDDSSWDSQPAWATPDNSGNTSRHRRVERPTSNNDLSPFAPGSNNVSVELGQVFLMGNLGDKYDSAIGTQIHYTYGVSDLFGFDSSVGYSNHSNGDFSMFSALMGVRTNLAWYDKVVPYGVFGMGFYRPSYQVPGSGNSSSSLSPLLFGVHLGPGIDLTLTKQVFFGASLVFHDIFGNSEMVNGQPYDVGGTYTTFLVHAGVTF